MLLTELPFGMTGHIFRSPMPFGGLDPHGVLWRSFLRKQISVVVLLAEEEECLRKTGRNLRLLYLQAGMHVLHLPIPDLRIPAKDALDRVVQSTIAYAQAGHNIVIHCSAGIGLVPLPHLQTARDSAERLGRSSDNRDDDTSCYSDCQ